MKSYLPEDAAAFRDYYARIEHVLRRSGYMKADSRRADVDWVKFAKTIGKPFFEYVRGQHSADTLIVEPPRVYHRKGGWQPQSQRPIDGIEELIVCGVCQVRHNIVHGEKFMVAEGPRSYALVKEAHWVLEQAIARHHDLAKLRAALGLLSNSAG